jgi:hypothetical protein
VSVLRVIEQKIESIVEGLFGRAFKASVQPVELARKLVKEMDDHRMASVSRVYVPNEYTVYLSPDDREQFAHYEASLRAELQDYLAEHARREGYVLLSAPAVLITTDADLDLGEFGIATRMVQRGKAGAAPSAPAIPESEPGATMVYRPRDAAGADGGAGEEHQVEAEVVTLTAQGVRHEITKQKTVIGRAQEADIQVADANVSRMHAELSQEGTAYWIADLNSTNGMEVNGQRLKSVKLEHGDTITVGSTDLLFERSLR